MSTSDDLIKQITDANAALEAANHEALNEFQGALTSVMAMISGFDPVLEKLAVSITDEPRQSLTAAIRSQVAGAEEALATIQANVTDLIGIAAPQL